MKKYLLFFALLTIFFTKKISAKQYLQKFFQYSLSNILLMSSAFCATAALHQGCDAQINKSLILGSFSVGAIVARALLRHNEDFTLSLAYTYNKNNSIDKYSAFKIERYFELNTYELIASHLPFLLVSVGVVGCCVYYNNIDTQYLGFLPNHIKHLFSSI